MNAALSFVESTAVVGKAGGGALGGVGGLGGSGKPGGNGDGSACDGGEGASGGRGGDGGHGLGGHAVIVAFLGAPPTLDGLEFAEPIGLEGASPSGLPAGIGAAVLQF